MALRNKIILSAFLLFACSSAWSQVSENELEQEYKSAKKKYSVLGDIKFSGVARLTSYYRNMATAYNDMPSNSKEFTLSAYPVALEQASEGANRGQPLLELVMDGSPSENSYFKVAYSFNHGLLGLQGDSSRQLYIRQFLKFNAGAKTGIGNIKLVAGGGSNWVNMSALTLSRQDYRVEPYEKLPWDWYTDSPKKYRQYYERSSIRTDERFGRTATQGFSIDIEDMPGNFGIQSFYGKTARNAFSPFDDFPFNTGAARVYKIFNNEAKWGVNYYNQFGKTSRAKGIKDAREIYTTDLIYKGNGYYINAELGGGRITSDFTENKWESGEAVNIKLRFEERLTKLPLELQFYSINKSVVSQESAALNSNLKAPSGGQNRTLVFDGNMFVNILQEADMLANNRIGGKLKLNQDIGNLRIELTNALSQEKENLYDTITIQHRVNSFTRSRFKPFGSNFGNYQRLRNRFMRTFETMAVTDSVTDYKKGFNTADLTLKYRANLGRKKLVLVNYASAGSVGDGFAPVPVFSSKAFYRQYYNEFSSYLLLNEKTVLIGFAGIERLLGNDERTILSPENGKAVNQTGTMFGLGLDWDFMRNGGIFIRHKWFAHSDVNFVEDKFRGQETSVELKIFF